MATSAVVTLAAGTMNIAELVLAHEDLEAGATGFALLVSAYGFGLIGGSLYAGRERGRRAPPLLRRARRAGVRAARHRGRPDARGRDALVRRRRARQRPVLGQQPHDAPRARSRSASTAALFGLVDSLRLLGLRARRDRRRRAGQRARRPRDVRDRGRHARLSSRWCPRSRCGPRRYASRSPSAQLDRLVAARAPRLRGAPRRTRGRAPRAAPPRRDRPRPRRRAGGSRPTRRAARRAAPHRTAPVRASAAAAAVSRRRRSRCGPRAVARSEALVQERERALAVVVEQHPGERALGRGEERRVAAALARSRRSPRARRWRVAVPGALVGEPEVLQHQAERSRSSPSLAGDRGRLLVAADRGLVVARVDREDGEVASRAGDPVARAERARELERWPRSARARRRSRPARRRGCRRR